MHIDDIGSFPLPKSVNTQIFSEAYHQAREALISNQNLEENIFVKSNFSDVILDSFRRKLKTGLDVVNYPQHYDGMKQIGEPLHRAMEKGSFVVDQDEAFLPEVSVIVAAAKALSEEFGKKILLRVSLFGPMELYLKEVGTTVYLDVLENFSETIRRFAANSIVDSKYVKTEVVSIDEPSFGFLNVNASKEEICEILDKSFNFKGATRQIHLHSATRLPDLLDLKNLDVVTFEYAGSPKNIESLSKKKLEDAGKQIRVGISRTDIDSITAELYEKGITNPRAEDIADSEVVIKKRFLQAKEKFGEQMTFTGPDCGLGSWPTQEAAELLLQRTVKAVRIAS
jgi:5-methyltetrahydropteroyltriglutamate--homocysteine methyltransferase